MRNFVTINYCNASRAMPRMSENCRDWYVHPSFKTSTQIFVFKLEARLPLARCNLKIVAVTHATRAYNLGSIGADGINTLMRDMKYIYPPSPSRNLNVSLSVTFASIPRCSPLLRLLVLLAQNHINTQRLSISCKISFSAHKAQFRLSHSDTLASRGSIFTVFRPQPLPLLRQQWVGQLVNLCIY